MHKLRFLFSLLTLALLFTNCSDDDNPTPGNLSISPIANLVEGVRGTEITFSVTANAADGIQSFQATSSISQDVTFPIPEGITTFTTDFIGIIPGDAVLDTEYIVSFTLQDRDGDTRDADVIVKAGKLISSTPSTYDFTRAGATTVSFSGQNERLDMVEEMKAYLSDADAGNITISAAVLNDAYANTNENGNGFFSFSSTKQLKDKTFLPDLDNQLMENLFADAEAASLGGQDAANGVAGFIERENSGKTILVDANGREFTQLIEKGLMGTVMYNQIYNTYFTDDRIGDDVENTANREGKNYTDMEHHWDEAFGYWNSPLDFTSNWPSERGSEDRFWSHYSNVVDPHLGTNDLIMQAFLEGRTAIVNNDLVTKDQKRDELYEYLELVAAAIAIHYINDTQEALNIGNQGEAFHVLSEAWAFVNALRYSPNRKLTLQQAEQIMESDFGADGNFWNVTAEGLRAAKTTLVDTYPSLAGVQDDL